MTLKPADKGAAIAWRLASGTARAARFIPVRLAPALAATRRFTVTIPADVPTGAMKLDGTYKGPGGAAPFVLTVRPADLKAARDGRRRWEPAFTY